MGFAERHWYRISAVSLLLFPLSLVFRAAVALRRALYRGRVLRSERLGVPVIVVGNLTVGGTGKTPLVLWLVDELRRRGLTPGIVSRGHGAGGRAPRAVRPGDDPARAGDEPVLLAGRSGVPVWIGADRPAAARALLAAHPACDVIVCDDGLQHYGLVRDFEIAVQDERGFGNGFLMPAGPLREPRGRPVDARVVNSDSAPEAGALRMRLAPGGLYRVGDGAAMAVEALAGKRLHAVAAIGNPGRFFRTLEQMGLRPTPHAFPDHHRYAPADLDFADCDYILMTEKDAVKCRRFGRSDLIALRVDAALEPALADLIIDRIHGRAPA
ncbi:MAG TPA: tetraacyldisaccharide 4'-kinase [Burkholderiales bacterium]